MDWNVVIGLFGVFMASIAAFFAAVPVVRDWRSPKVKIASYRTFSAIWMKVGITIINKTGGPILIKRIECKESRFVFRGQDKEPQTFRVQDAISHDAEKSNSVDLSIEVLLPEFAAVSNTVSSFSILFPRSSSKKDIKLVVLYATSNSSKIKRCDKTVPAVTINSNTD